MPNIFWILAQIFCAGSGFGALWLTGKFSAYLLVYFGLTAIILTMLEVADRIIAILKEIKNKLSAQS